MTTRPPLPPNPDALLRVARTALLSRGAGQSRTGLGVAAFGFVIALAALVFALYARRYPMQDFYRT